MTEAQFRELLTGYRSGQLNEAEVQLLEQAIANGEYAHLVHEDIEASLLGISGHPLWTEDYSQQLLQKIKSQVHSSPIGETSVHRVHFLRTAWIRYAAAIILLIGVGYIAYLWTNYPASTDEAVGAKNISKDVLPGGNKAVLTLADGRTIVLDSAGRGQLAEEFGAKVIKTEDGKLEYQAINNVTNHGISYNTMSTPNGGQYQLRLPDGSQVWLNAASSITYPTIFSENTRTVTITGEVYFEVAKDKKKPFIVKTGIEKVIVLGTSFNVNAYQDEEAMKTSLVEGSVEIAENILRPGQAYTNGQVVATSIEQDIAWKNGVFNFNGASLPVVLRQLARWYDLEIRYEGTGTKKKLIGKLSRNLPLSEVIKVLQDFKVNFRMEGKTLVVQ